MVSSLPSQNDNHAKGLCKDKCHDCKSSLEYMTAKDGLLTFKCMNWNKTYAKKFDKIHPRDSKTHIRSTVETSTNFVSFCGELFIDTSTWMAGKDSMKCH